jgi:hypothetical protein
MPLSQFPLLSSPIAANRSTTSHPLPVAIAVSCRSSCRIATTTSGSTKKLFSIYSSKAFFLFIGTLTASHSLQSLPSAPDPAIIKALETATSSADVRVLHQLFDVNDIHAAWPHVSRVQRSALLLARSFQGTIFHDLSPTDL